MSRVTSLALLPLLGLAPSACSSGAPGAVAKGPDRYEVTGRDPAAPFDHPPVDVPPVSRATRRMTVEMLEGSVPVVAGAAADGTPIQWTRTVKGQRVSRFSIDEYGAALGRPDYRTTTEEPTEPSALYVKFMDDMARDVCGQIVAADATRADGADRTLARFAPLDAAGSPDEVRTNLRYLKLRFLGQRVADDDDAGIADLETLYQAASTSSPRDGWQAVCVGLMTSPAFHVY